VWQAAVCMDPPDLPRHWRFCFGAGGKQMILVNSCSGRRLSLNAVRPGDGDDDDDDESHCVIVVLGRNIIGNVT